MALVISLITYYLLVQMELGKMGCFRAIYVQATSSTPTAPLFDDCECMAEEYPNDNTPLPQSVLTNNGKY